MIKLDQYQIHLFDFDGVIADTAAIKFQAFDRTLCCIFESLRKDYQTALSADLVGVGREKVAAWAERNASKHFTSENWLDIFGAILKSDSLFCKEIQGATRYLERLRNKGSRLFVISSAPLQDITSVMGKLKIQPSFFEAVHGVESGNKTSLIAKLLKVENLSPTDVVFYGDMPTDARAANTNGVPFVRLLSHPGIQMDFSEFPEPLLAIHDFSQLLLSD